jgi:replicative DNA helicase
MPDKKKRNKVPLSPGFQYRLISSVFSGDGRITESLSILKPEHFSAAGLSEVWRDCLSVYKEHSSLPTFNIVKERMYSRTPDRDERQYYYRILRKCRQKVGDQEVTYIVRNIQDFAQLQTLAAAYRDSLQLFERGDLNGVRDRLSKALLHHTTSAGDLHYFTEVFERVKARRKTPSRVVRTLITPLDARLRNNGLRRKETGVVLAPTGAGKTRFLCHIAKAAVLQRQKTVYYTLQLPPEDIAEILDATFASVEQNRLIEFGPQVAFNVSRIGKVYGDSLVIKYFPRYQAGINTIEAHLQQLKALKWFPDMIVVDFLNYLMPSYHKQDSDQRYFELQSVVAEWITLCQRYDMVGWGGFQARRSAREQELVTVEDIAESYGAAMEATLVVSINRTPAEKEKEMARLHIAKYTHGMDGVTLPIHTNYRKGAFFRQLMV